MVSNNHGHAAPAPIVAAIVLHTQNPPMMIQPKDPEDDAHHAYYRYHHFSIVQQCAPIFAVAVVKQNATPRRLSSTSAAAGAGWCDQEIGREK